MGRRSKAPVFTVNSDDIANGLRSQPPTTTMQMTNSLAMILAVKEAEGESITV